MKTILVTGGSGMIGSAICEQFAKEGYAVVFTYNKNKDKAMALLKALKVLSDQDHHMMQVSNTDTENLTKLKAYISHTYGHLDVLVNNAGITTPVAHDDLDGLTDEWIDAIFTTNFKGGFTTIRSMIDLLRQAASPSLIVNISSVAAITGIGSNVAYCASKAAVDSMTRSLARALAPAVRVVSVSPGWVLGEYTKNINPDYIKQQLDHTPLARLALAQDVANAVYALTTTLTFCTGNTIQVDGGRMLG